MTFSTHGFGFQWYRTYERGYETSGSPLCFRLRRSSLVECISVLHGTGVYKASIFFLRQYVQPCLFNNSKYTFYTIKSKSCFILLRGILVLWCGSQINVPNYTKSKQTLTRKKGVRKRVKHRERCKIVKSVTPSGKI
jgi:hypothetical protein